MRRARKSYQASHDDLRFSIPGDWDNWTGCNWSIPASGVLSDASYRCNSCCGSTDARSASSTTATATASIIAASGLNDIVERLVKLSSHFDRMRFG